MSSAFRRGELAKVVISRMAGVLPAFGVLPAAHHPKASVMLAPFSTSILSQQRIALFVRGATEAHGNVSVVRVERDEFVADVQDAVRVKFPRLKDAASIRLRKVLPDGSLGEPLVGWDTVEEAKLGHKDMLVVEVTTADAPLVKVRRTLGGEEEAIPMDAYTMRNIRADGGMLLQVKLGASGQVEQRRWIITAEQAIEASKTAGKDRFLLLESPFTEGHGR